VLLLTAPLWQAQGYTGKHGGIRKQDLETALSSASIIVVDGGKARPIKPTHPPGGPGASLYSLAQSQAGGRSSPFVGEHGAVGNFWQAAVAVGLQ